MSADGFEFATGLNHPIQILVIEPLFEEANRCRRMIAQMMRQLEVLGIGARIASLPGCGESLISIENVSLSDWLESVSAQSHAAKTDVIASFRGGALLDAQLALPVWRFAPEEGARIVRDLERTKLAGAGKLYAGHPLSPSFLEDLRAATLKDHTNLRTVRLEQDAADAEEKVSGSPLWRRAEPGEEPSLSQALAKDLADWAKSCVNR